MGVTGLLPLLKKTADQVNVSQLAGKTVAIDAYVWLHRGAFSCADKLARGEKTTGYVGYGLKMLNMLIHNKVKPILVFDGRRLKAKEHTEKKRHEIRKQNKQKAEELSKAGRDGEARDLLRRSVDVNHLMALELMKAARKINVDCIVAPHEADAQLAYLNRQGFAQVVITEDSDLILFGCTQILYKLDINGNGLLVQADKLHLILGRPLESPENLLIKLRQMCILSGCDYATSLPGVGLVKAKKFVMATSDPDFLNAIKRLPSYLNLKVKVDEEYIEKVAHADLTFRKQLVFDPKTRRQVTIDGEDVDSGPYSGTLLEPEEALQLAIGNLDPFSMDQVANFDVNTLPTSSIWSGDFSAPKVDVYSGPVSAFVTNKKLTQPKEIATKKILPRPKMENRPSAWRLDLELTEMYSKPSRPAPIKSAVTCTVNDGGQLKQEVRSSYFISKKSDSSIISIDEDDANNSSMAIQSTPKSTSKQPSLLQQIEESPSKKMTDTGPISNNPFAKKINIPASPILNRYCLSSVNSNRLLSPSKDDSVEQDEPSECESAPMVADSDEGTLRDSLFEKYLTSYEPDDSLVEDDSLSLSKPNLARFKFRRPLFSKLSQSSESAGDSTQEVIMINSPEKSPIINKRKRNENLSPSKRMLYSKYFNDSKTILDMLDDNSIKSAPVRGLHSNCATRPSMTPTPSSTKKPTARSSGLKKPKKGMVNQASLLKFGFFKTS